MGWGAGNVPGPGLGDIQPDVHPSPQAQRVGGQGRVATLLPGLSTGFLGQEGGLYFLSIAQPHILPRINPRGGAAMSLEMA